jgi:tRNA(Arg) A34 adenosine deaminase TadA
MYYISKEWDACYRLALEAAEAGSIGVGSIITDGKGEILARGRNQMFDNRESMNKIRNTTIAHAELNAMLNLPEIHKDRHDLVLYTSVEPCPMCLGAVAMSNIRHVYAGSCDGWAGGVNILDENEYMNNKGILVTYLEGPGELLLYFIHLWSELPLFKNKECETLKQIRVNYIYYDQELNALMKELLNVSPLHADRIIYERIKEIANRNRTIPVSS